MEWERTTVALVGERVENVMGENSCGTGWERVENGMGDNNTIQYNIPLFRPSIYAVYM